MPSPLTFGLLLQSDLLDIEATFNDWPIVRRPASGDPVRLDTEVSWLMCEGQRNEAEVRVRGNIEDRLLLTAILWRGDRDTAVRTDFATYRWHPQREPRFPRDIEERLMSVVRHGFSTRVAFGTWAWERAERYEPRHREPVMDHVRRLHAAFVARDIDQVMALFATKFEHLARTSSAEPGPYADEQRALLLRVMTAPDYRVELHEPTLVEGRNRGRLIWMENDRGLPPIVVHALEARIRILAVPSMVDGAPLFVR